MGDSITLSLQNLTGVFQTQNQRIQQLIEDQQQALSDSLQQQQATINEKIGQIDNPFEGLKEMFDNGLKGIKDAFEMQNSTIQELLTEQNMAFADALKSQQEIVLKKLQEAPTQLQALTDIAKSVERLNQSISKLEKGQQGKVVPIMVQENEAGEKTHNTLWSKCKTFFVPIGAFGSFLALIGLLLLQIFGS